MCSIRTDERLVIFKDDRVRGRARVTTDEDRVLWQGWREIKLWRYWCWLVVRIIHVRESCQRNVLSANWLSAKRPVTKNNVEEKLVNTYGTVHTRSAGLYENWCFQGMYRQWSRWILPDSSHELWNYLAWTGNTWNPECQQSTIQACLLTLLSLNQLRTIIIERCHAH